MPRHQLVTCLFGTLPFLIFDFFFRKFSLFFFFPLVYFSHPAQSRRTLFLSLALSFFFFSSRLRPFTLSLTLSSDARPNRLSFLQFSFLSLCQTPSEPRFSIFPFSSQREASKGLIPWSDGWEWRWTRDLRTGARRRNGVTARSRRCPFARRRRRKKR